jgi:hypothetical protein
VNTNQADITVTTHSIRSKKGSNKLPNGPLLVSNWPENSYTLVSDCPHPTLLEIQDLLDREVLRQTAGWEVANISYQLHLCLFPKSTAILWQGVEGFRWESPILCSNGHVFRAELLAWSKARGPLTDPAFMEHLNLLSYCLEMLAMIDRAVKATSDSEYFDALGEVVTRFGPCPLPFELQTA